MDEAVTFWTAALQRRFQILREAAVRALAADGVDGLVLGGGHDPRRRVLGHALLAPRHDGLAEGLPAVLVDALGTWVAAHPDLDPDIDGLVAALVARRGDTVLVSDEVGLGVHPSTEIGRRFRDVLGGVNTAVADVADDVLLVIAGRILPLPRL